MIRSAFRPSDDATTFPFLVPANAMAVVELRHTAALLRTLATLSGGGSSDGDGKGKVTRADGNVEISRFSEAADRQVGRGARWSADRAQAWELQDGELTRSISLQEAAQIAGSVGLPGAAARCERLAEEVDAGIVAHGTVERPELGGKVYAYEVDGFGNAHLMDDANVPSLLSLPWLGYLAATDPTYERTRAYVLSPKTNVRAAPSPHTIPGRVPCLTCACGERQPWFYTGTAGEGVGSPHTGPSTIWPMAIIMRALTASKGHDVERSLAVLQGAAAAPDSWLMHESFRSDDAASFTRPWFAWANSLFGSLIMQLSRERPHLIGIPK